MTSLSRIACTGLLACVSILFALPGAAAQQADASAGSSSPVAFVYVSHPSADSGTAPDNIVAWSANAQGKLTPVSGSPFAGNVIPMAVNGKYLFAGSTDGSSIDTFLMSSTGALKQIDTLNDQKYLSGTCDQVTHLVLDHTGATLYSYAAYSGIDCAADSTWQSFKVDDTNGSLSYLGATAHSTSWYYPLRFIGDDVYAFEASGTDIYGFRRESNGMLAYATDTTYLPAGPSGETYNALYVAANPTNHLAVTLQPNGSGATQLGTYTVNSSGHLSTNSTVNNMPKGSFGSPYYSQMSPSGKLLAVGGTSGLQVFHFNGGSPLTHYTGLLTTTPITQMYWDNDNHLYAISRGIDNKLYVFTVTATSCAQAPGSPYTISDPLAIIVQPKTAKP
ncbi:MAG TPA: hypothetical protein VME18_08750 [Acidobacteriaceae bacterium]|nr:hypothetical protein [Acidobacteriaceae bacterium]